jgi:hypothetical protein
MDISLSVARMKPVSRELAGCHEQLKRLADYFEVYLAQVHGCHVEPHKPDESGEEPMAQYTDETEDFMREYLEKTGKLAKMEDDE